jgi:serine/threonine protein kinase
MQTSTSTGTTFYMSPEALDRRQGVADDVWSVALVLLELLAGTDAYAWEDYMPRNSHQGNRSPQVWVLHQLDMLTKFIQRGGRTNVRGLLSQMREPLPPPVFGRVATVLERCFLAAKDRPSFTELRREMQAAFNELNALVP